MTLLVAIVVAVVVFALVYDVVAHRRGRYLPARHWEGARRARQHARRAGRRSLLGGSILRPRR